MKEKKKKKQKSEEKQKKKKNSLLIEEKPEKAEKVKKKKKQERKDDTPAVEKETAPKETAPKETATKAVLQKKTEIGTVAQEEAAKIFRALGDETRLNIVGMLEEGELCAADLLKSVSIVQSTLSHHMKILCESGAVNCRREGRWSYYSINQEALEKASAYLKKYRNA